jgi:SagB-type dehydrogenase family enzyme
VEDLAPGLYQWDPAARRLAPRRQEELAEALVDASLGQRKTAEAAAALVGVARLAEATARGGARAYRHLLLEAGATAQRVYLAAEAQGHTARNLAAYYDDDLNELLGLDGEREVAVHLTAVGLGD